MSTLPSIVTLTNSGSGYANHTNISPKVNTPIGTIRVNHTTGQIETFDGSQWIAVSIEFDSETIRQYIQTSIDNITNHINTRAPNNATIQDALGEWLAACERFKVIVTLAEHSK
jgi:predicted aldo/keto reductase-like oxidoreductase